MLDVILSYLPYALITTFTPGPNNLMSLYSVSSAGWKKGSRVILGIFAGVLRIDGGSDYVLPRAGAVSP